MLALEVAVEPANLLPLDDRKRGVERIEVGDLNVRDVEVVLAAVGERNPLAHVIALFRAC